MSENVISCAAVRRLGALTYGGDVCVVVLLIAVSVDDAGLAHIGVAQYQNLIGRHKVQRHVDRAGGFR